MTRTLAVVIVLILTATTFAPLAAFAYSYDKKNINTITPHGESIAQIKPQTDLKVPANADDDPSISVISLANQDAIISHDDNSNNNNNNQLAACTNQSSQKRGIVPPFCVGHLTVIKHVINDDGGTNSANDFTISVDRLFPGAESPGNSVTLTPGSFSVSETGPTGYTQSLSGDCSGTINAGDNKVCTIANNDNSQTSSGSITIRSVRCVSDPNVGPTVAVEMTVSGQVHDSHSITVQVQTFAPSGYLINLSQYTVPADAPDPATTTTGTSFVSSPNTPAGTYKIVVVTSDGQSISTTFEAPDCSLSSGNTS